MRKYTTRPKNTENFGPICLPISSSLLPAKTIAAIPMTESPASVTTNPMVPETKESPARCPIIGGKIMFPAPKNMANSARETETICPALNFSFISNISLLIFILSPVNRGSAWQRNETRNFFRCDKNTQKGKSPCVFKRFCSD